MPSVALHDGRYVEKIGRLRRSVAPSRGAWRETCKAGSPRWTGYCDRPDDAGDRRRHEKAHSQSDRRSKRGSICHQCEVGRSPEDPFAEFCDSGSLPTAMAAAGIVRGASVQCHFSITPGLDDVAEAEAAVTSALTSTIYHNFVNSTTSLSLQ